MIDLDDSIHINDDNNVINFGKKNIPSHQKGETPQINENQKINFIESNFPDLAYADTLPSSRKNTKDFSDSINIPVQNANFNDESYAHFNIVAFADIQDSGKNDKRNNSQNSNENQYQNNQGYPNNPKNDQGKPNYDSSESKRVTLNIEN